ncbi:major facilitator superfamily domain-containing protein [Lasiosphaeris hirsuta]|uniref:Major facilitator superfamily domain-containing protein n=1 Tax=Lasiosphaeris hirsuta TaxID=260670 RepID=A0AA40ANT5_9PEZI|nr:major facilitator superfamily domain-containing protein [Lasiosphaeris hirsuta]
MDAHSARQSTSSLPTSRSCASFSTTPSTPSTLSLAKGPAVVETVSPVTEPTTSPDDPASPTVNAWARGPGFWRCFVGLCIPILLSAFEGSVVSTALPTISQSLGLGPNSSWVATAFLLASIVCQPLYGQLADIWGRRHLMMIAVFVFGLGSALSGVASSGGILIFGRVVQGLGSGGIDLFAELILCDIIPLQRRGHYVAIKAAVYALGTTVGPVLGGVFAEGDWRWCFYVNIPVCLVALVMMWLWLQVSSGTTREKTIVEQLRRVDFVGITLLTASVVLILFALGTGGAAYSWAAPIVLGTAVAGCIGIIFFAVWERVWCPHPIMAPHVFSNRTTVAAFVITILHGFVTYGFQFYLPPFFQAVLGVSPTESGVFILPCTLTIVVLAAAGGPLLARFGQYRLMHLSGFILMALGFVLCTVYADASDKLVWVVFSFVVGIGSGIIVSTTLPSVLVELTDKENAAATGSWAFLRGLGSLLGVAVPGAAFNAKFSVMLPTIADAGARAVLGNGRAYEHASANFIASFDPKTKAEIISAFSSSLKVAWIIFLILAVVGFLVTFLERQVKLRMDLDSDFGLKRREKGDVFSELEAR